MNTQTKRGGNAKRRCIKLRNGPRSIIIEEEHRLLEHQLAYSIQQQAPYRIEIQEDLDGFLYSLFPKDDTTCHQTKRYGNPQRALVERP